MDAENMQDKEFTISHDLQRRIEDCAARNGTSPEELVRRALDRYETKTNGNGFQCPDGGETWGERATRLELVGCLEDAPSDLSTNKKHFEGFGT
jgi:hypothetical protein